MKYFKLLLVISMLCSTGSLLAAADNESWANLRFVRDGSAPQIARESFRFRPDGWIEGRIREGNSDFWRLSSPQSADNIQLLEPELWKTLENALRQIGPDGKYRSAIEKILKSANLFGTDLDAALAENATAWNTNMGWANVLQVKLKGTHVFYVAFYAEHCCPDVARNVPVDAAIVPDPSFIPPSPVPLFVDSQKARSHLSAKKYAHCAQQALLDAGFDPKGVDGAPGPGARKALVAFSDANSITLPDFTRPNAAQICFALTAPQPKLADQGSSGLILRSAVWPLFPGVFYNDNLMQVSLLGSKEDLVQSVKVDFGPNPIRYGDQNNKAMTIPWDVTGSVIAHGTDAPQEALAGLVAADGFHRRVLDQMLQGINIQALDNTLAGRSSGKVLWSQVTDNVYMADILLDETLSKFRVVIFFTTGKDARLLYGGLLTHSDWSLVGEF